MPAASAILEVEAGEEWPRLTRSDRLETDMSCDTKLPFTTTVRRVLTSAAFAGLLVITALPAAAAPLDRGDADGDGMSNLAEYDYGTNPDHYDTDNDGLADPHEIFTLQTNPLSFDTDNDGVGDYAEVAVIFSDPLVADTDGDGAADAEEVGAGTEVSPPTDTDGDGLYNDDEARVYGTNPDHTDTDLDGLTDGDEVYRGTTPTYYDTDNDGLSDGDEVYYGTDPRVADAPAPEADPGTDEAVEDEAAGGGGGGGGDDWGHEPCDPNWHDDAFGDKDYNSALCEPEMEADEEPDV
jgi:hypothetical protein